MQEFVAKVKDLWDQKAIIDAAEARVKQLSEKFQETKKDILKQLEVLELDKQHVPGCGTVYRQIEFSVKVPKDPSSKEQLFQWIAENKGKDVLDNMVSINSQSLNSFYKKEMENAVEAGNVDFALPGIEVPEVYWKLGMKKG